MFIPAGGSRRVGAQPLSWFAVALTLLAFVVIAAPPSASAAEPYPVAQTGSLLIEGHGYGHGHGMSQYGARGAARRGLSAAQIVAFYYPGTALVTAADVTLRVGLTSSGQDVTVLARSGLGATWPGGGTTLPALGTGQWRLVADGGGLAIQYSTAGGWATWWGQLPAQVDFVGNGSPVRMFRDANTSIDYRGTVGGVRSASGVTAVNRVSLEDYVRGVVPREMPSSWETEAVRAQVIAARSYARYALENGAGGATDICDTTACQVYGGMAQYRDGVPTGVGETAATNAAVDATRGEVVTWNGRTAFTQFSASDGGWMTAGSKPYLVSAADPYEQFGESPYYSWTRTVSAAQMAAALGWSAVTGFTVTARDGAGDWGGRVTSAVIGGLSNGQAVSRSLSGDGLAWVLGVYSPYLHVRGSVPLGSLDVLAPVAGGGYRVAGWAIDTDHSDRSTQVQVFVDNTRYVLTANVSRPDVQAAYGLARSQWGFDTVVPVPGGVHTICVWAIDLDGIFNNEVACRQVTVGTNPPIGSVDVVGFAPPFQLHSLRVAGWTLDPDHPGEPTPVHVYVDGVGHAFTANLSRPDVAAAYGLPSAAHGFDVNIPIGGGGHTVCIAAIDLDGIENRWLQCASVVVPSSPIGNLDAVGPVSGGSLSLSGWGFDPDAAAAPITVTVDGANVAVQLATQSRPDVAAVYGLADANVGFRASVPLGPGTHQVCVTIRNVAGAGADVPLGCRSVQG